MRFCQSTRIATGTLVVFIALAAALAPARAEAAAGAAPGKPFEAQVSCLKAATLVEHGADSWPKFIEASAAKLKRDDALAFLPKPVRTDPKKYLGPFLEANHGTLYLDGDDERSFYFLTEDTFVKGKLPRAKPDVTAYEPDREQHVRIKTGGRTYFINVSYKKVINSYIDARGDFRVRPRGLAHFVEVGKLEGVRYHKVRVRPARIDGRLIERVNAILESKVERGDDGRSFASSSKREQHDRMLKACSFVPGMVDKMARIQARRDDQAPAQTEPMREQNRMERLTGSRLQPASG